MRNRWAGIVAWAMLLTAAAGSADDSSRAEHPRPDARREEWLNLNGDWQFAFDPEDRGLRENWQTEPGRFDRRIVVPFGWQSRLSGLADTSGQRVGWYCRTFRVPPTWVGKRVWLHFDAVDCEARVWVNGQSVGGHEGGYTPFQFDITHLAGPGSDATVVLRDGCNRSGTAVGQAGRRLVHPDQRHLADGLARSPTGHLCRELSIDAGAAPRAVGRRRSVSRPGSRRPGGVRDRLARSDGTRRDGSGDDFARRGPGGCRGADRCGQTLDPDDPHLVDLEIRLKDADGVVDLVHTYVGLRTVGRGKHADLGHESVLLNGEPIYLRGVLDQSFNPEGIYTAPSDEFLRRDLEIARQAGFNLLRIHVKSEEPRKLYWADRMGLLVVQDMPCTFQQSRVRVRPGNRPCRRRSCAT